MDIYAERYARRTEIIGGYMIRRFLNYLYGDTEVTRTLLVNELDRAESYKRELRIWQRAYKEICARYAPDSEKDQVLRDSERKEL